MSDNNGGNGSQHKEIPRSNSSALAIAMLKEIEAKTLDPALLTQEKRLICLQFLVHEGKYTVYEMSQILAVSDRTIYTDKKKLREGNDLSNLILDEASLAQDYIEDAGIVCAKLKKVGKWKDAFEVRDKCLDRLQSMGFIKKVPKEINLKGKLSLMEVLDLEHDEPAESGSGGFEDAGATGGRMEAP